MGLGRMFFFGVARSSYFAWTGAELHKIKTDPMSLRLTL